MTGDTTTSRRKSDGCLLCGTKRVAVMGVFVCTTQPQPPVRYFLCVRCMRKPDTPSLVEAVLMVPQGSVS